MSEVQPRGSSTRGRGGFRGGRGGYRGARGGKSHTSRDESPPLEEQGEIGELKAKYADKLPMMREICEGYSDEDLVFALQDSNGDEVTAMDKITSGSFHSWGEVKKKAPKGKESGATAVETSSRGRGRGGLESRGRGRGADRGARGAARGARTVSHATNGTKHAEKAVKTSDETEHATTTTNGDAPADGWANEPGKDSLDSLETDKPKPASSAAPAAGKSGGWAGLFAKPPPPPPPKAEPTSVPAVTATAPAQPNLANSTTEPEQATPAVASDTPAEESLPVPPPIESIPLEDGPSELPSAPHSDVGPSDLTPPADELTKENVNKLPDESHPIATQTAASTAASTQDPINPALPNVSAIRPGMSGHSVSALRATQGGSRNASYSRKVMDQQEAVVMPANHAVDRAAVQFGKMGLDADDADADEDREDPETRTQLPDDSPAAPRASLPPGPGAAAESHPASQAESAEPLAEAQAQPSHVPSGLPSAQTMQEPTPPQANTFPDQYRYGQNQKGFDPFSQQPHHAQAPSEPFSNQLPGQSQGLPNTSQSDAYAQFYARDYNNYYAYNQGQEPQRSGSAFGTSAPEVSGQYAAAGGQRYASHDMGASGNNTPNPHMGHQNQHSAHMSGPNAHGAYPYGGYGANYGSAYPQYGSYGSMGGSGRYGPNRPRFDDVRQQQQQQQQQQAAGGDDFYSASQYGYGQNQGYSGSYGKSGMYGGPQHQYSHDYSSSPGSAAFAGRDGYGRAGSTQPSDAPASTTGSHAFSGGIQDPFARGSSGFGQAQHGSHSGSEDPAKPTGPSPSLQGGRPSSAAQGIAGQQQGAAQNNQQAFAGAGYGQYSGFGNNTHHSGYGGYGSNNAFAGYAGGYGGGRGGWPGYGSGQH